MISKIKENKTAMCMVICAVLMAILLFLQFAPFWHYGEAGETCSISSYVWFPGDHKALENWLISQADGHDLNSFVGMPILILVLSAIGTVICLLKPDKSLTPVLPVGCGLAGVIGYLGTPALRLGAGWVWHLLICVALLGLGIYGITQWVMELRG